MKRSEKCAVCSIDGVEMEVEKKMKVGDLVKQFEDTLKYKDLTIVTD